MSSADIHSPPLLACRLTSILSSVEPLDLRLLVVLSTVLKLHKWLVDHENSMSDCAHTGSDSMPIRSVYIESMCL